MKRFGFLATMAAAASLPLIGSATPRLLAVSDVGRVTVYSTFSGSLAATVISPESFRQAEILFATMLNEDGYRVKLRSYGAPA